MKKRRLFNELVNHIDNQEYTIITGPRQSGKTVLLGQLAEFLDDRGDRIFLLTLEDPVVLSKLNSHPENLFDLVVPENDKRIFVLIDEIQYLDNPSNFLKLIYDKHHTRIKIVATGSSAFYIDKKFRDSLAGRKRIFDLYTLSFDEFLEFRTGNEELAVELTRIRLNPRYISSHGRELNALFNEYLTFGGYPAVVLASSAEAKKQILKELINSYIKRDIIESNISDSDRFYQVMLVLAHQTGSLVNVNELSTSLKLSTIAVENFLYVFRKCFHIHLLRPFHRNIRKELIKMPKAYFHDLGLRNILMNQFNPPELRADKGELIENYAFIRLREKSGLDNLHFWRTADGREIDFVLQDDLDSGEAIEIKFDYNLFKPGKYKQFTDAYPGYPLSCRAYHGDTNERTVFGL